MSFFGRIFGKKKKEVNTSTFKPVVEPVKEATLEPIDNKVTDEVVVKETPVVEEKQIPKVVDVVEIESKSEVVVEKQGKVFEKPASVGEMYEVRTHKGDGWQVIKNGASRARRRFDTQAECINYCKDMNYKFEIFKKDGEKR